MKPLTGLSNENFIYSSHFVCLSVADLEDSGLLALQRDTNLAKQDDYLNPLICYFFEIRLCSREKAKNGAVRAQLRPHPLI